MRIEFVETITLSDFAQVYQFGLGKAKAVLYSIWTVLAILMLMTWFSADEFHEFLLSAGIIFMTWGLLFVVLFELVIPYVIVPNLYNKARLIKGDIRVVLDDEKMTVQGTDSQSTTAWKGFLKWKETKDILLFYPENNLAVVIPKRYLSLAQLEELRDFLVAHFSERDNA